MNSKWGARSDDVELRLASEQVNYISINSFQLIKSLERTPQSLVTPFWKAFHREHCSSNLWNVIVRPKLRVFAINLPIHCKCGRFHPSRDYAKLQPTPIFPLNYYCSFKFYYSHSEWKLWYWHTHLIRLHMKTDFRIRLAGGMRRGNELGE